MANNAEEMIRKLQICAPYTDEPFPFKSRVLVGPTRSGEIRRYFRRKARLNLDKIADSRLSTWEKTLTISQFISDHIPHDNQKKPIKWLNAIQLWEYAQRVPTGFNCRWHAILLSELLLSIDIKNRFVTCMPEDKDDQDCHVVNLVWLPEMNKWAMIDCDQREYVTGPEGVPLSLEEMRTELIVGGELNICQYSGPDCREFLQGYWAKNLYWFSVHMTYGYDLEGLRIIPDTYVHLVPPGYDIPARHRRGGDKITTNAAAFWQG